MHIVVDVEFGVMDRIHRARLRHQLVQLVPLECPFVRRRVHGRIVTTLDRNLAFSLDSLVLGIHLKNIEFSAFLCCSIFFSFDLWSLSRASRAK